MWFVIDDSMLSNDSVTSSLNGDVTQCQLIDGLGRRVRLRKQALPFARQRLEKLFRVTFTRTLGP